MKAESIVQRDFKTPIYRLRMEAGFCCSTQISIPTAKQNQQKWIFELYLNNLLMEVPLLPGASLKMFIFYVWPLRCLRGVQRLGVLELVVGNVRHRRKTCRWIRRCDAILQVNKHVKEQTEKQGVGVEKLKQATYFFTIWHAPCSRAYGWLVESWS